MGALDGFYSTWNKARETFGQGAPTDGSQFDQSRSLTQMKASVEAAAPDDRWQGSGANAYAAANKEHAQVYQKLADLDQKMAAEVKNAANVVSAGRTNLDNAKSWVEGMANSLPATSQQDRERKLIPIAREGINRVDNIVKSATADMMGIKGRVEKLKGEWEELTNQKFAPPNDREDPNQVQMVTGDPTDSPNHPPMPDVALPGKPWDPDHPYYGNLTYGNWETISTSPTGPYPPLDLEYRDFGDDKIKVGPTTGLYVPNKSWAADADEPAVQFKEGYRFRIAGTQPTDVTRMVYEDGQWQVQRWVSNVYEYQRNTAVMGGNDLGALPPITNIDREWKPISIPEITALSAKNANITYYLPDGCGGAVTLNGGVPTGSSAGTPQDQPPIMTRPR